MSRTLIIAMLIFLVLSSHAQEYQLSKPLVKVENNGFFEQNTFVSIDFKLEGAQVRYTMDGSEPTKSSRRYRKPIKLTEDSEIKVKAFKRGFEPSETIFRQFKKVDRKIDKIEITPQAKAPYQGGGVSTLTDLKAGSLNFRDGNWLGYNGESVTLIIDLGQASPYEQLNLSMLSSPGSWIFPPESVEIYVSKDGQEFIKQAEINPLPIHEMESARKSFYPVKIDPSLGSIVKAVINPVSSIPDWHPGKGNPAWVFIDEIIVR